MNARTKYQTGEIRLIHRSELKNAPYNPRRIKPQARRRLENSLKNFKLVSPIIWNQKSGHIVGGHRRVEIIDSLEGSEDYMIEVNALSLSDADEMALNIQLNNPASQGEYDDEKLGEVAAMLIEMDFNIERTGFTTNDLINICGEEIFVDDTIVNQVAAESNDVDLLNEIKQVSKFTDDIEPAESSGPEATDGREDEAYDDDYDDVDEPEHDHGRYQTDESHVATAGTSEAYKDYDFKKRRKDALSIHDKKDTIEGIISFVFETPEQAVAFERHFGLTPGKAAYDIFEIEAAFGLDLTNVDEGQ
jgi:hypothetical protein